MGGGRGGIKKYVIIHAEGHAGKVLLVKKEKPEWQRGCLNLVGGAIEPDETPYDAAIRELKEESGYSPSNGEITLMGTIVSVDDTVYCYRTHVDTESQPSPQPRVEEKEVVRWFPWVLVRDDKRLVPSLRVVLPLMMAGVYDWKLYVWDTTFQSHNHYELTIPNKMHPSLKEDDLVTKIIDSDAEIAQATAIRFAPEQIVHMRIGDDCRSKDEN